MTTLALNAVRAKSVRLQLPWTGVWLADVDLDLPATGAVAAGQATLTIGAATLQGTAAGAATGTFAKHAKSRVVGGADGWSKSLPPRHYHNDAGVRLSSVLETTAAEARETIVAGSPTRLGVDYVRMLGPASRVLDGLDWYTDFERRTIVGARATAPAPASVQILSWDPEAQRAELACDDVVVPGMVLKDDRFGTATVRDVEQTWGDGGARAIAWCGVPPAGGSRLGSALAALIREKSGIANAREYRYRVVREGVDKRLTLQAVEKVRGVPDMLAISVWPGMAGLSADLTPGTEVLVTLIAGDVTDPAVVAFQSGAPPRVLYLDATNVIVLAGGSDYVALASLVSAQLDALKDVLSAWSPVSGDGGAALKALLTPLIASGWPHSVAASKVKAA